MHKINLNIIGLAWFVVSVYGASAAERRSQIPSLRDLALESVIDAMTSKEQGLRFARDPQQLEAYLESLGIHKNGAIKELLVDQLLKPYYSEMLNLKKFENCSYCESMVWHPNGKLLALGLIRARDYWIHIFDWQKNQKLNELRGHRSSINAISWHPKENILASGSDDCTIRIWNIAKAKEFNVRHWKLFGTQDTVKAVAWHPSGELLASGSNDGMVHIWDWRTGKKVKEWKKHHSVKLVSWHPSGELLLTSGSDDGMICIWNWKTGQDVHQLRGDSSVESVSWHPSGELLAIGFKNGKVHTWRMGVDQDVERFELSHDVGRAVSVSWHPKGDLLAMVSDQKICVLDRHNTELKERYRRTAYRLSFSWHPEKELLIFSSDYGVYTWDVKAKERFLNSLSLMQALYFVHYMKHASLMQLELARVVSEGKQEEDEGIDDRDYMRSNRDYFTRGIFFDLAQIGYEGYINVEDIEHDFDEVDKVLPTLKRKRFMRDLEASLPDEFKNAVKRKKQL